MEKTSTRSSTSRRRVTEGSTNELEVVLVFRGLVLSRSVRGQAYLLTCQWVAPFVNGTNVAITIQIFTVQYRNVLAGFHSKRRQHDVTTVLVVSPCRTRVSPCSCSLTRRASCQKNPLERCVQALRTGAGSFDEQVELAVGEEHENSPTRYKREKLTTAMGVCARAPAPATSSCLTETFSHLLTNSITPVRL